MWERRTNPYSKHRFYDQLSRLIEADYNFGAIVYNYGYDVAGNMVDFDGVTRIYNAANQMVNDGMNFITFTQYTTVKVESYQRSSKYPILDTNPKSIIFP